MSTYNCLHCGKECVKTHQKTNKFCSVQCSTDYRSVEHKKNFWNETLDKTIDRATARRYIAEVRGYNCELCGISEWQGKKLTLHVDHTNGDPGNNSPKNLRLLCPNCHSQTEFLGAANKGRGRGSQGLPLR